MRVRNFTQIMLSKETDGWTKQFHGPLVGTTSSAGTVSLSISGDPDDTQYVTDLSFSSNVAGCAVDILNGTAFLFYMKLPSVDKFVKTFSTPLKSSKGTAINIHIYNIHGTSCLNLQGYTVK